MRGVETQACRWPCTEFMLRTGIREEFDKYICNADLTSFMADKPNQHLHLTHTFTEHFSYNSRTSRAAFHLYDSSYSLSLDEFYVACKLPFWGSLDEPHAAEYSLFLGSLCHGEDRGLHRLEFSVFSTPLFTILHFSMENELLENRIVVRFVPLI